MFYLIAVLDDDNIYCEIVGIEAKSSGFSDVLFLDAATGRNIEEASACFIVKVHSHMIDRIATF
ncbi:hypothetical protein F2Q70_00042644 [Brassica cretica]|uniref:Uncharacterized protein n=1 Tax=Brassica cretica TaxID=69181 RepID=A0A8S9KKT9_BRACR|nr:hypothetical protein F2Q70_00042644 [Brassica cretica]